MQLLIEIRLKLLTEIRLIEQDTFNQHQPKLKCNINLCTGELMVPDPYCTKDGQEEGADYKLDDQVSLQQIKLCLSKKCLNAHF